MRIPSIKFSYLNHITQCSYHTYIFDLINNPNKLLPGLIPIGYCPGTEVGFKPSSSVLGLMVMDTEDNFEFWQHVSPKQIGYVFGKDEELKAKQLCEGE